MKPQDLQQRTKIFALRIIKLAEFLESNSLGRFIGRQIFRSGTSVAANYRAACRSRSVKDFVAKLGIVIEEIDETLFWLEILKDSGYVKEAKLKELVDESNQILAIMVASKNSTVRNQRDKKS